MARQATWCTLVFVLGWLSLLGQAYVPAMPTNDSAMVQASVNQSDTSMLALQWFPNASFSQTVSYQLVGNGTNGVSMGALVHFSEQNDTNQTTTTPWIAFISCDTNGTNFSMEDDVFTLARDRGAVSALLYSEWSEACIINSEYADPATFDQVFDIFSTKSLTTALTVENAFTNINETLYYSYNATTLNDSFSSINNTISTHVVSQGYLFAKLTAFNATASDSGSIDGSSQSSSSSGGSGGTNLAMIVLYVITGGVSVLFCLVILSGAVRAIRHPERYGPRPADPTMGDFQGQSRTRGLTRAILDTFPVIKFSRVPATNRDFGAQNTGYPKYGDEESGSERDSTTGMNGQMLELTPTRTNATGGQVAESDTREARGTLPPIILSNDLADRHQGETTSSPGAGPSTSAPTAPAGVVGSRSRDGAADERGTSEVLPDSIGRETCPICILDFEEGDDLRVLPCEGKHVFHQACVDQWLLELSSSCPLCRHDFIALEEMIAGSTNQEHTEAHEDENRHSTRASRFSRYLRFARGRRQGGHNSHHRHRPWGNRDDITEDPTDPPYPVISETTL